MIRVLALALAVMAATTATADPRHHGANIVQVPGKPLDGADALRSLGDLRSLGADTVAIVPFQFQARPDDPDVKPGGDMTDAQLAGGIEAARRLGLQVMVKPHVWIEGHWAGQVRMTDEAAWAQWFANYERSFRLYARIAARTGAQSLVIGTELEQTSDRPEWPGLIARIRAVFPGRLLYVAHGLEEAERITFWSSLDAVGVTLYPELGPDSDEAAWSRAMGQAAMRLDALAKKTGKQIWVAEIGLRSADGAAARPWESAEERPSPPDMLLQARVLAAWHRALARPSIAAVLIWRWLSDPDAGGPNDTDFTIQNKPAAGTVLCLWRGCTEPDEGSR